MDKLIQDLDLSTLRQNQENLVQASLAPDRVHFVKMTSFDSDVYYINDSVSHHHLG